MQKENPSSYSDEFPEDESDSKEISSKNQEDSTITSSELVSIKIAEDFSDKDLKPKLAQVFKENGYPYNSEMKFDKNSIIAKKDSNIDNLKRNLKEEDLDEYVQFIEISVFKPENAEIFWSEIKKALEPEKFNSQFKTLEAEGWTLTELLYRVQEFMDRAQTYNPKSFEDLLGRTRASEIVDFLQTIVTSNPDPKSLEVPIEEGLKSDLSSYWGTLSLEDSLLALCLLAKPKGPKMFYEKALVTAEAEGTLDLNDLEGYLDLKKKFEEIALGEQLSHYDIWILFNEDSERNNVICIEYFNISSKVHYEETRKNEEVNEKNDPEDEEKKKERNYLFKKIPDLKNKDPEIKDKDSKDIEKKQSICAYLGTISKQEMEKIKSSEEFDKKNFPITKEKFPRVIINHDKSLVELKKLRYKTNEIRQKIRNFLKTLGNKEFDLSSIIDKDKDSIFRKFFDLKFKIESQIPEDKIRMELMASYKKNPFKIIVSDVEGEAHDIRISFKLKLNLIKDSIDLEGIKIPSELLHGNIDTSVALFLLFEDDTPVLTRIDAEFKSSIDIGNLKFHLGFKYSNDFKKKSPDIYTNLLFGDMKTNWIQLEKGIFSAELSGENVEDLLKKFDIEHRSLKILAKCKFLGKISYQKQKAEKPCELKIEVGFLMQDSKFRLYILIKDGKYNEVILEKMDEKELIFSEDRLQSIESLIENAKKIESLDQKNIEGKQIKIQVATRKI